MGINPEGDKQRLKMSTIFALNHFGLLDQRIENKREVQAYSSWSGSYRDRFQRLENSYLSSMSRIESDALELLEDIPIWHYFLSRVEEIPPIYSLALVENIGDITDFTQVQRLWSHCGMHSYYVEKGTGKRWFRNRKEATDFVVNILKACPEYSRFQSTAIFKNEIKRRVDVFCVYGERINRIKVAAKHNPEELRDWNLFLRTLCWRIGESFNYNSGHYHNLLIEMEESEVDRIGSTKEVHLRKANLSSRRHITKKFLIHVGQYWRQMEGLPLMPPLEGREACEGYPGMPPFNYCNQNERLS